MHLLAAEPGRIVDGDEAVDLGQSPGDFVFLSAADTELAVLSDAFAGAEVPFSLRLANIMRLKHPLSVDVYLDKTCASSSLIVARLLGGRGYWSYLIDELSALCRARGIELALLPGDDKPDPDLANLSTLDKNAYQDLWAYLREGGPANARGFLKRAAAIAGLSEEDPVPPRPLLKSGLYYPGIDHPTLADIRGEWSPSGAPVMITFYRALLEGGNTGPVDALIKALNDKGVNALPVFVPSLKDETAKGVIDQLIAETKPSLVLNSTGFAASAYDGSGEVNPFRSADCPVLQVVLAGTGRAAHEEDAQGLAARDLAMHVVLPELDGRIFSRAIAFKSDGERDHATEADIQRYQPDSERVNYVAELATRWIRIRETPPAQRKIALILANYPNRDGRIGNGVGYDTPASSVEILRALQNAGYETGLLPKTGNELIEALMKGPTNAGIRQGGITFPLKAYKKALDTLHDRVRSEVEERWGRPEDDPFLENGSFHLPILQFGNVFVGIQPARGYNIDPKATYHDPDLVPPHGYFAFYMFLKSEGAVDAVIHNGKHGNLEWLPGKALALSEACYPEAVMGPVPNLYPFIVNDPGEGTQAKRRLSAVIIDHLTPPLTRAEAYGPLKDLEALVDEYYMASGLDPRRLRHLRSDILDKTRDLKLDLDAGIAPDDGEDTALQKLDAYLCDLKEAQIRDGLHILGNAPEGEQERDLLVALTRVPRRLGEAGDRSIIRALADDFGLSFDPLDCNMAEVWGGSKPEVLAALSDAPWRSHGDTVERLELMAHQVVETGAAGLPQTSEVIAEIADRIRPALRASGENEIGNLLKGLDGRFVPPGASGAPTRGRLDVLPTGRNFFSIDNRTLPTPAAWALGQKSADLLLRRYFQDQGTYPKAFGLSAWGTSNMRTGGDDIAQALALIGVKPKWEPASLRVTGFEVIPLSVLGRPRIDVTLRISGFFRDAFPAQIALFDSAVRKVASLEEEAADNPIAARSQEAMSKGADERDATIRVFGSKPGAYGAGLQAMIDEQLWQTREDLARAYIEWGGYAYGAALDGKAAHGRFEERLGAVDAVLHNQDNREHDLLDSDDYYQFEGGMSAAVETLSGQQPVVFHNDHSRPERPIIRTLEDEIGRVMRSRVANPKWIAGVMRHGYKGAFEIAATVDYMFAFAATTGAVKDHHFDLAYDAFIADQDVFDFLEDNNAPALQETASRLKEAIDRKLWTPRLNSAYARLEMLGAEAREDR
ncbi:MAG: cobaltochelatase subunit CobN [Pseudomonadota bacterium]